MAVIKCKMCGGDIDISDDKTFGTCEYCGSVMTLPKVSDEQNAARFNRGNGFRRSGDFDKALAVYEAIVRDDDANAEAHWCCALCRFGIEYVEDPATFEYIPTCHRASFDSFLEDIDYLAALEHSDGVTKRQYQREAVKIAEVQKRILATSQNEKPFDVFLCYKETDESGSRTRDSLMAQDVYYQLTERGYRVFFSRITLEDKAGAEYEPYIFAALNSAKVMVAIGTKAEHFNSVWVKNEWSRFLAFMRRDRSKLLLPCYRDMDPYDLPEQLSVLQSYDMAKIGFIQDLIRGIEKVVGKEGEKAAAASPQVIMQGSSNAAALLKRGSLALEDGEWDKADGFFDEVLNLNAECAEAYLGKALAARRCRSLNALVQQRKAALDQLQPETLFACDEDKAFISAAVVEYTRMGLLGEGAIRRAFGFDRGYQSCVSACERAARGEGAFWQEDKLLSKAVRFSGGDFKRRLSEAQAEVQAAIASRLQAERENDARNAKKISEAYRGHLQTAKSKIAAEFTKIADAKYRQATEVEETAESKGNYLFAGRIFEQIKDYKDAAERAAHCQKKYHEMKEAKQRAAIEAAAAAAKRKTIIKIVVCLVAVLSIAAYFLITRLFIPMSHYKDGKRAFAKGDYNDAIEAFRKAGDYKNSAERVLESYYKQGENYLASDNPAGADVAFKWAGSYSDAAKRIGEGYYKQGEKYLASDNPAEADKAFESAGSYSNAAKRIGEGYYKQGENYLASDNLAEAIKAFEAAGNYSDAAERILESYYKQGEKYLASDNPAKAAKAFEAAENYSDAAECLKEICYKLGTEALKADKQREALETFDKADDYSDAAEQAKSLRKILAPKPTIAAGDSHTVGLKSDGTVIATGENDYFGQCNVSGWRNIVAVSAGEYHTVGLKSDGTVVAVGRNIEGQCNISYWKDIVSIAAAYSYTVGLKSDGTVVVGGDKYSGKCDVSDWKGIVAVAAGDFHTVGLKSDGTVVATGKNDDSQCNVSDWKDIIAIAASWNCTVGLKSDGTVVVAGYNAGMVSNWRNIVSISAGSGYVTGVHSDKTVVATKYSGRPEYNYGQCDVSGWRNIVAVAAGDEHTVGLKSNGTVVAIGYNASGQCNVSGWKDIAVHKTPR